MDKQNFLNSVKEIITLLNNIDTKILNLNDTSGNGFLFLTEVQKNYYKFLKTLSQNITDIKNLSFVTQSKWKFEDKNKSLDAIFEHLNNLGNIDSGILRLINTISNKTNILSIILSNFMQNINTLKLLGTGQLLKTTIVKNTSTKNNNVFSVNNDLYSKIDATCNIINKSTNSVYDYINNMDRSITKNLKTLSKLNGKVILENNNINNLKRLSNELSSNLASVNNWLGSSFNNTNEVIVKLQYHDIIRQKLEHIQHLLKKIVSELDTVNKTKENNVFRNFIQKYLAQIPKITILQAGQLIKINSEFQSSTSAIIRNLNNTAENIYSSLSLFRDIEIDTLEASMKDFKNKTLISFLSGINSISKYQDLLKNHMNLLNNSITVLNEKLVKLIDFTTSLILKVTNISNSIKNEDEYNNSTSQYYEAIESKLKDTKLELKNILKDFQQYNTDLSSINESLNTEISKAKKLKELILKIKSFYNIIFSEFKIYKDLSFSNSQIKSFFKSNKTLKFNKTEYYTDYDHTVNEVIKSFNKIINILKHKDINIEDMDKSLSYINNVKNGYTVESEYEVHKALFPDDYSEENQKLKNSSENDELGDVELF